MNQCKLSLHVAGILLLFHSTSSFADEWHSADGIVAVATPDPNRFDPAEPSPPTLAKWISKDGNTVLTIKEKDVQTSELFTQYSQEQDFLAEMNSTLSKVKLLNSTMQKQSGYYLFTMTIQGNNGNTAIYFTKSIFSTSNKHHIALAAGIGIDTRTCPGAVAFMGTFKPLTTKKNYQTGTTQSIQQSNSSNTSPVVRIGLGRGIVFLYKIIGGLIASALGVFGCRKSLKRSR